MRTPGLRRGSWLASLALLAAIAGGCSDNSRPGRPDAAPSLPAPVSPANEAKIAYSHTLTLDLPQDRVAARFEAVRDRCLKDAGLRCVLVHASIRAGARTTDPSQAQIDVRLPHDAVAPYFAFAVAPLPGEPADQIVLRDQATRAEDLTVAIQDGSRRIAQFRAYRDKLDALAGKPDTPVDALIKVARELASVQAEIETAESTQRALDRRVDTELVSLHLRSDRDRAGVLAPVEAAWAQGGRLFGESAGTALRFLIVSVPWLPIVVIGILGLRALWRLRRRRESAVDRVRAEDRR